VCREPVEGLGCDGVDNNTIIEANRALDISDNTGNRKLHNLVDHLLIQCTCMCTVYMYWPSSQASHTRIEVREGL